MYPLQFTKFEHLSFCGSSIYSFFVTIRNNSRKSKSRFLICRNINTCHPQNLKKMMYGLNSCILYIMTLHVYGLQSFQLNLDAFPNPSLNPESCGRRYSSFICDPHSYINSNSYLTFLSII